MEYYSARRWNETESVLLWWMNLDLSNTEWTESETEKQTLYINAYTGNLGRWHCCAVRRAGTGADREGIVDAGGGAGGGAEGERCADTRTLSSITRAGRELLCSTGVAQCCSVKTPEGWGVGGRVQRRGGIGIHMADSRCRAETDTTL